MIESAPGVGENGGSCTCPNGEVYQVGDNGDKCASLACLNGTSGKCTMGKGEWSNKKVICGQGAPQANTEALRSNISTEEKGWKFMMSTVKGVGIDFSQYQDNGFVKVTLENKGLVIIAVFWSLYWLIN